MAARMKNGVAFMEISTEVPQKAKCRINILSSHFIYEYFPVVIYGCESWTVKKAECQRIDAFELWYWRRLLRIP